MTSNTKNVDQCLKKNLQNKHGKYIILWGKRFKEKRNLHSTLITRNYAVNTCGFRPLPIINTAYFTKYRHNLWQGNKCFVEGRNGMPQSYFDGVFFISKIWNSKIIFSLNYIYISLYQIHIMNCNNFYTGATKKSATEDNEIGKGKAVPLQAWNGPEGSRKLRFPDFMTTAQDVGKVVCLTHRPPLPLRNTPRTHFC